MFEWIEEYGYSPQLLSLSLLSVFILMFLFKLFGSRTSKLNLPPSPPGLPIIGNLHQLGSLPHRSLQALSGKHGPLMLIRLGQAPTLVVSSADGAKEILKTHDLNFAYRPKLSFAKTLTFSSEDLVFSTYSEYWRQVKKLATVHVLSAHRVETYRSTIEEEVVLMMDKIRQSCSSVVDLGEMMFSFTNDLICRVTLGRKFGADEGGKKFLKIISEYLYFAGVFNVGDYLPWLAWVNHFNGFNRRIAKTVKDLDCFLETVIAEHIESRKRGIHGVEDFIHVLLGIEKNGSIGVPFDKDNIKALVMDIFVAGTDTSSVSLIWVMTELIRHPEIMKEVQTEIRRVSKERPPIAEDDLQQMHYLKAVIKETLRLHLPGPIFLPHESMEYAKVQGYDIPAKTRVLINAWAIARDPMSWDEPEEFKPKRFLNSSMDYRGHNYEYLPFGAGRRGCPGIHFATTNIVLALANLLYHFDWTLPDGVKDVDITEGSGLIAFKKFPLLLVTTPAKF